MTIRAWPFASPPLGRPFRINRASPQAVGLVGWWPVSPGGMAVELAAGSHGVLMGGAGWSPTADVGAGLLFDGTDDYVAIASAGWQTQLTGAMTLAGWFRPATVAGVRWPIADGNSGGSLQPWALEIGRTAGRFSVTWAGNVRSTDTTVIAANSLYHVVMVRSGSSGAWVVTWYINGVPGAVTTGITTNPSAAQTVAIGRLGAYSGSGFYSGLAADLRLYNRALSAAEVFALYAPQTRWDLYGVRVMRGRAASGVLWPSIGPGRGDLIIGGGAVGIGPIRGGVGG